MHHKQELTPCCLCGNQNLNFSNWESTNGYSEGAWCFIRCEGCGVESRVWDCWDLTVKHWNLINKTPENLNQWLFDQAANDEPLPPADVETQFLQTLEALDLPCSPSNVPGIWEVKHKYLYALGTGRWRVHRKNTWYRSRDLTHFLSFVS